MEKEHLKGMCAICHCWYFILIKSYDDIPKGKCVECGEVNKLISDDKRDHRIRVWVEAV